MAFYHARHALFPDEYIKIITVQTDFLITDLLAIVLYSALSVHVFSPLSLFSFALSKSLSVPCLFICTSEYKIQSNVISIRMKIILKMPIFPIIQCNYKPFYYIPFFFIINQRGNPREGEISHQRQLRFLYRHYHLTNGCFKTF